MNRLAGEPSAYLRQHANNPVDWQPYGDAAFEEAAARGVPVFLSIGYAACHWCHVMAHESFEDPAIGEHLNRHFVAIKVDREERPDVDAAYMAATQAISGQGGWPMSVFLLPDGRAFHAGTYFPPQPLPGMPSFRQVLDAVLEAWTDRRDEVEDTAARLTQALAEPAWQVRVTAGAPDQAGAVRPPQGPPSDFSAAALHPLLAKAVDALVRAEDPVHGGFGGAPKFPPTPALEFLIRHAGSGAGEAGESGRTARGLAGRTLNAMVNSSLFDQLGGGFARYSVTADWSQPHYEKMLYDNAGLLGVLAHWVRLETSGRPVTATSGTEPGTVLSVADARRALDATAGWLLRELRLPNGAFASSLDADTVVDGVHHEGASYLWTAAELAEAARGVAPEETGGLAAELAALMNLPDDGTPGPLHLGRALNTAERARWERLLPALLVRRAERVMPARDAKVVAGWNGLLISALADTAAVLEAPHYLEAAIAAGHYLCRVHHGAGGLLSRVSHDGAARGIVGLLEDYAACAAAYQSLYAATGDRQWFEAAPALIAAAEERFIADGMLLDSAGDAGALRKASGGPRAADPFDDATASAVSLLAGAFLSHAAYTGSGRHRSLAEGMLATLPELVRRAPRVAGGMLSVAESMAAGPLEVAVVGPDSALRRELVRTAATNTSPGLVLSVWDGAGPAPVPLQEGRGRTGHTSGALAYVCRNMVCARPVSDAPDLAAMLS